MSVYLSNYASICAFMRISLNITQTLRSTIEIRVQTIRLEHNLPELDVLLYV